VAGKVKHRFPSPVADEGISTEVGPDEWDDSHVLSEGTDGDAMVRRTSATDGWELIRLGANPLWVKSNDVGSVGAGETDLHSFTVPAAHFNVNNRAIRLKAAGVFAANANAKTLRVRFGSGTAIVINAVTASPNGSRWSLEVTIIRRASNDQEVLFEGKVALLYEVNGRQLQTETDANALVLKVTGQATSNNDITINASTVEYLG